MNKLAHLVGKSSTLLESYRGHDQVLSLIGYKCKMLSGLCVSGSSLKTNLSVVSTQIANARVILRLLDDPSMLSYTLSYGLGKSVSSTQLIVI
jgi:hypothetical protein